MGCMSAPTLCKLQETPVGRPCPRQASGPSGVFSAASKPFQIGAQTVAAEYSVSRIETMTAHGTDSSHPVDLRPHEPP